MNINYARKMYLENPERLLAISTPGYRSIVEFIKYYSEKTGIKRGVIGLSGGVDSALVAELAVRALGKENVLGVMMPAGNQKIDLEYATRHAEIMGIEYHVVDLKPVVDSLVTSVGKYDFTGKITQGNRKARLRMITLFDFASQYQGIVLGTGNKSEDMIGYFTKYGDGGVDILPIAQLFKTQVWKISEEIGVPAEIVKRTPTAGLWAGQTDEGEIGVCYKDLDKILLGFELGFRAGTIEKVNGLSKETVQNVLSRIPKNAHKLEMPPMPAPKFEGAINGN